MFVKKHEAKVGLKKTLLVSSINSRPKKQPSSVDPSDYYLIMRGARWREQDGCGGHKL